MIIIDTRSPAEYAAGHVEGALNISPDQFMTGIPAPLSSIAKDTAIVVYCLSGSRSNVVRHILGQYGFTNVTNGINKGHVEKLLTTQKDAA